MATSRLSRHASEVLGVVLFAAALLWIVALVSYSPSDAAWFFHTGASRPPANFAGRVGAFLAELSFQAAGYLAYTLPLALCVAGWHYFWCRDVEAPVTKAIGAFLLFTCGAALLALAFDTLPIGGRAFLAGGWYGAWSADLLTEYLNRTGALILTVTVSALSLILATQVSLGTVAADTAGALRARVAAARERWRAAREERARAKQREEVLKSPRRGPRLAARPPTRPSRSPRVPRLAGSPSVWPRHHCRCPPQSPSASCRPSARGASSRCRRSPCSTRRAASGRSTSAN